jgi:transcriptional regulator with XRE-family HTH domain
MTDLGLPPTSKEAIGRRLSLTRRALGLTASVMASNAGINKNTYSQYESGTRVPALPFAIKLCDRFDLTLDWLYRGDPSGLKYTLANQIIRLRRERNTASSK